MTVHRDKFLIIEPNRCTDFSKVFIWNETIFFGQFLSPSSGVFHCAHSNGICITSINLTARHDDLRGMDTCSCTRVKGAIHSQAN